MEAAALFFVMFLVSLYQTCDSWDRNTLRNECRAAIPANYDVRASYLHVVRTTTPLT